MKKWSIHVSPSPDWRFLSNAIFQKFAVWCHSSQVVVRWLIDHDVNFKKRNHVSVVSNSASHHVASSRLSNQQLRTCLFSSCTGHMAIAFPMRFHTHTHYWLARCPWLFHHKHKLSTMMWIKPGFFCSHEMVLSCSQTCYVITCASRVNVCMHLPASVCIYSLRRPARRQRSCHVTMAGCGFCWRSCLISACLAHQIESIWHLVTLILGAVTAFLLNECLSPRVMGGVWEYVLHG